MKEVGVLYCCEVDWILGIWSSAVRAHGGCLGADRRGRTWQAAKSQGEPHAGVEPWMSEWGNPEWLIPLHSYGRANPGN